MSVGTRLIERLGISCPIIQAPMAGGGDTPALVAAVSEAGGLGFIGAAYLGPDQIAGTAAAVRAMTSRPFGINLFAPQPDPGIPNAGEDAVARVAPFFQELGLARPKVPSWPGEPFPAQLEAALASGAAAFSFTFGLLPEAAIEAARDRGMLIAGTATTPQEARRLEASGVDAVIAQGGEAGGHRGTFDPAAEPALIGTMALVPQVVDAVRLPVIASGGIMDGRGIAAALALGAQAAQLGTAFLTCEEAGVAEAYKTAVLGARAEDTRITRAFSGRAARGIENRVMRAIDRLDEGAGTTAAVLAFPLQNALTRPMRSAAARQGRADYLSLWAGQGAPLARRLPAARLIAELTAQTQQVIDALGR